MAKKSDSTNPFCLNMEIPGLWKLRINNEEWVEGGLTSTAKADLIDIGHRISTFTDGILSWFPELSSSAKDMYMYIAHKLGYETDVIEITEERYCSEMNVSRPTFYRAKHELTDRLILPRSGRRNTYWVNPGYLYRGDRRKAYGDKIVETNENPLNKLRAVS